MTTISFAGGRGNAPGTYVYEQVAGSIPGRAAPSTRFTSLSKLTPASIL